MSRWLSAWLHFVSAKKVDTISGFDIIHTSKDWQIVLGGNMRGQVKVGSEIFDLQKNWTEEEFLVHKVDAKADPKTVLFVDDPRSGATRTVLFCHAVWYDPSVKQMPNPFSLRRQS